MEDLVGGVKTASDASTSISVGALMDVKSLQV